jgi:hypothetical protein
VDHDRREAQVGDGVDDGFMRIQVRVPRRSDGLAPLWGEVLDATIVEEEYDGFER